METTIIAVIESLDSKSKEFRDQVNALRDFKLKMRDAGAVPEEKTVYGAVAAPSRNSSRAVFVVIQNDQ